MGAYHSSQLPMLFGTHGNYRGESTEFEIAVSEAMQDAWQAFASDPHQGLAEKGWDRFTQASDSVRWFGEDGTVARNAVNELKNFEEQC